MPKQDHYEISHNQRQLWILDQFEENQLAYNIPLVFEMNGGVNFPALQNALSYLVKRHESLRTVIIVVDDEPRQKILEPEEAGVYIEYIDLKGESKPEEIATSIQEQDATSPFVLHLGPLMRVKLIELEVRKHILLVNLHHIISDGWSLDIMMGELFRYYASEAQGQKPSVRPLRIQYKDFVAWENRKFNSEVLQQHKQYWMNKFEGIIPALELPLDKPRPIVKTASGAVLQFEVEGQLIRDLKGVGQERDATLFMCLVAIFNILFYRYTGQQEIILGSAIAGRERPELEKPPGYVYQNTGPIYQTGA